MSETYLNIVALLTSHLKYLINNIESVHINFTKRLPGLLVYRERLQILNKQSVVYYMTSHCATISCMTIVTQQFAALLLFAVIISRRTVTASYCFVQLMLLNII